MTFPSLPNDHGFEIVNLRKGILPELERKKLPEQTPSIPDGKRTFYLSDRMRKCPDCGSKNKKYKLHRVDGTPCENIFHIIKPRGYERANKKRLSLTLSDKPVSFKQE